MKKVDQLFIAIMFNDPLDNSFDFFDLAYQARKAFKKILGSIEPLSTSVPDNVELPPDFPKYTLKTDNGDYNFTFSRRRFGFDFENIQDFTIETLEEYLMKVSTCLNSIDSGELKPFRIGTVIEGVVEGENKENLLSKYIATDALDNNIEHQIALRNKTSGYNQDYNTWTKYAYSKDTKEMNFLFDVNFSESIDVSTLTKDHYESVVKKIGDFIEY